MSVTDMVMQYNYSEGSDSNSDFSKNVDKDPILFAIDSKADMIETSLTEEYASSERHSLKRRNETSGTKPFYSWYGLARTQLGGARCLISLLTKIAQIRRN